MKSLLARVLLLALPLLAASLPAQSGPDAPVPAGATFERIAARGSIVIGHRESSVPFAYYGPDREVMGYSQDLAQRIVQSIRQHLNRPDLPLQLVPVTPQNRIAQIQSGAIDLECGSTTHNSDRSRQVAFSNTIFIIGTRLMTRRASGINDFRDLTGRTVVTTAGTTSERLLHRMNEEKRLRATIITTPDHADSFLALESGQADAFMMDDALLYGELAKARAPEQWMVTGTPQSFEAYGCMMLRGDLAFKRLVDDVLAQVMASGEAEQIYRKWFMSPLPSTGLNLNFPLSDAMRALYRTPNDKPFQ